MEERSAAYRTDFARSVSLSMVYTLPLQVNTTSSRFLITLFRLEISF